MGAKVSWWGSRTCGRDTRECRLKSGTEEGEEGKVRPEGPRRQGHRAGCDRFPRAAEKHPWEKRQGKEKTFLSYERLSLAAYGGRIDLGQETRGRLRLLSQRGTEAWLGSVVNLGIGGGGGVPQSQPLHDPSRGCSDSGP